MSAVELYPNIAAVLKEIPNSQLCIDLADLVEGHPFSASIGFVCDGAFAKRAHLQAAEACGCSAGATVEEAIRDLDTFIAEQRA